MLLNKALNYKNLFIIPLLFLSLTILSQNATAHATTYSILSAKTIQIRTGFVGGTPMQNAIVKIFPPNQKRATIHKYTDTNGIFSFTPNKAGVWIMQVRDNGGHGMRINLEIDDDLQLVKENDHQELSLPQQITMILIIIWALIATAFAFKLKFKK